MGMTLEAVEEAYHQFFRGQAICRPRIDIQIPTKDPSKLFQWGTMEGGSTASGYFAIRMKSDILYEQEYLGVRTEEKYCLRPGLYCGLILLIGVQSGEPLALIHDGYLQHMRSGARPGIGVKYMAREDAEVVGMLGSGGMARSHAEAFCLVRKIKRIQVYSPTREHREVYAREMSEQLKVEVEAMDEPRKAFRGAHIISDCTDSLRPPIIGQWLEKGCHITTVHGDRGLDEEAVRRIGVCLRAGTAPAPEGWPEFRPREHLRYALPGNEAVTINSKRKKSGKQARSLSALDRPVFLEDFLAGKSPGRRTPEDITYWENGNLQGLVFYPVAARVYELAKEKGLGREIPTEWLLQDIRD